MKEFSLLFMNQPTSTQSLSNEEMRAHVKRWENWIGEINAQGKLVSNLRMGHEIRTVRSDKTVINGPVVEANGTIGGNMVVKANTIDEGRRNGKKLSRTSHRWAGGST